MPRRSFFGGGNRDKKSSSKKQLKLSQKYVQDSLRQQQLQQQQQRQKQPQQQWENRPSRSVSDASRRSQTSSSQDTPPHQLGPTQTELTSNNICGSCIENKPCTGSSSLSCFSSSGAISRKAPFSPNIFWYLRIA